MSVIDAIFVGLPAVERGRIVRFFALSEEFERPLLGPALRKLQQVPIRRGAGDWGALQEVAGLLSGGSVCGIAPEGTIGDGATLLPGSKGAARIALLAGTPVIPVGLWGSQRRWGKAGFTYDAPARPNLAVAFGPPIPAEGNAKHRPDVQALTDRIMQDIGTLVGRAQRMAPGR